MSTLTAIDLSKLPAPDVVEVLDFETIFADRKAQLITLKPELVNTLELESEPLVKFLQEISYRELYLRQRINEAAKAVMLPYAIGTDLDNLAALFGLQREQLEGEQIEIESDESLRQRIQLSIEGFTTAGSVGSYIFHAINTSYQDETVKDVAVTSPNPGEVTVTVLSNSEETDGVPSVDLLNAVTEALDHEDVRPLTDLVQVQPATIIPYIIDAELYFPSFNPGNSIVIEAAQAAIEQYIAEQHFLGKRVTLSGVLAALHQPGVEEVVLLEPTSNIDVLINEAAFCDQITLQEVTNG